MIYSLVQAFFWMAWSSLIGFSSNYLLEAGLNSSAIGMLIALFGILSSLLQPMISKMIDRRQGINLKKWINLLTFTGIVSNILLMICYGRNSYVSGLLFGIGIAMLQSINPLINALALTQKETNFGLARGVGSVAYAMISAIVGLLITKWNIHIVPVSVILCFIGLLISVKLFPQGAGEEEKADHQEVSFMHKYPKFMVIMVGAWLVYISHIYLMNFGYQIILTKGGNSTSWGNVGSIAALMELPAMFGFAWLLKYHSSSFYVKISGIFFCFQSIGALLAGNMLCYYANQIFQLSGWAVLQVASVYYVGEVIEKEDLVKGQTCFTTAYTLSLVAGSISGGVLIDVLGVNCMLWVAIIASLIGSMIIFFTIPGKQEAK